jgi:hypothetical protein
MSEIRRKLERSSLGTPAAKAARQTVSSTRAAAAVARAAQIRRKSSKRDGG